MLMKPDNTLRKWALFSAVIGILEGIIGIAAGSFAVYIVNGFYNEIHWELVANKTALVSVLVSTEPERQIIIGVSLVYAVFNLFYIIASVILIYGSLNADEFYTLQWVYMTVLSVFADLSVIISVPLLASYSIERVGMDDFEEMPTYFALYSCRALLWISKVFLAVKVKKRANEILDDEDTLQGN